MRVFLEGEHADPGVAVVPPGVKVERKSWGWASKWEKKRKRKTRPVSCFLCQVGGLGSRLATRGFIHLQKKLTLKNYLRE